MFRQRDFLVISTSFSSTGLNQGFPKHFEVTGSMSILSILFMVVKLVPIRIYSLRSAIDEFRGSCSFCHEEGSSKWLSILPIIQQMAAVVFTTTSLFLAAHSVSRFHRSQYATTASTATKQIFLQQTKPQVN